MKIKDKNLGSCFLAINITTHGGILGGIFNTHGKKLKLNYNGNLFTIGAFNSNKKLKNVIEAQERKKLKKLYIDGKEVDLCEEKSLASLGLQEGSYNLNFELAEYL